MIKCAFISSDKILRNDNILLKENVEYFNDYKELLNDKAKFDIIFFYDNFNRSKFIDVYHELAEIYDNLIFIVVYNSIEISKVKKGFEEGIFEFVSIKEIENNFEQILNRAKEHINILKSKEKVYKYTQHKIFIKIPSDINLVNETVLQIVSTAKVCGFIKNKKIENNIRLALTEGIVNAIVHGNKCDKKKDVIINVFINFKKIKISIKDMGEGFEIKDDMDPCNEENILKSSGRGVYLMKILMDEVNYDKNSNELILIKFKDRKS